MPSVGSGTYSPGPNMVCSPQQEKVGTGSIEASTCPVYIDLRIRATVSYSRKILAGMASPHQDLTAVLQILYAALAAYGCPQALVSDNGSVFTAKDYLAILR